MPRYNNILTIVYLPKIEQYHIIYHVMSITHDNVYQDNVYQNNVRHNNTSPFLHNVYQNNVYQDDIIPYALCRH